MEETLRWIDLNSTFLLPTICFVVLTGLVLLKFVKGKLSALISKLPWDKADGLDNANYNDEIRNICRKYSLSKLGFLPEQCLESLPKQYAEWERIASKLPILNRAGKLRSEVMKMELIGCEDLTEESMLHRAFILLGMLVHSFVNGDKVAWDKIDGNSKNVKEASPEISYVDGMKLTVIPPQLAVPWYRVCQCLDLPVVLTAALDLWNWKLKDPAKGFKLSNLCSVLSMTGTQSEMYFHMVPCAMQAVAGPVVPKIFLFYQMLLKGKGIELVRGDNKTCPMEKETFLEVVDLLNKVENVFKKFKEIMLCIKELVDKEVFYDVYRPLIGGFWPDGVVLKLQSTVNCELESSTNVCDKLRTNDSEAKGSFDLSPKSLRQSPNKAKANATCLQSVVKKRMLNRNLVVNPKGPSAGQSSMILTFDLLLGISHHGDGKEFQNEVLYYMPAPHRQFLIDLRGLVTKYGSLRDLIYNSRERSYYRDLAGAYNSCVQVVSEFRALHLGVALSYLRQADKGTGASSFRDMLKSMLASTKTSLLQ